MNTKYSSWPLTINEVEKENKGFKDNENTETQGIYKFCEITLSRSFLQDMVHKHTTDQTWPISSNSSPLTWLVTHIYY